MRSIFGREPAVFFAMAAAVLQAVSLFFGFDGQVQALVNAVLVAAAGFATAAMVSTDAALPALLSLVKAVLAVLLGFGLHVPGVMQVAVMAVVTAVGALFVRQQVTAPVPVIVSRAVGTHAPFEPGR